MIKKTIWLLVSLLMVISLVMASCGPAEEEEAEVEVGEEEVEVGEEEVEVGEEEVVEEEGQIKEEEKASYADHFKRRQNICKLQLCERSGSGLKEPHVWRRP